MRATVSCILLAGLLSACAAAQYPPRYKDRTVNEIAVGQTTREDVLMALGLPERTAWGGQAFYYDWIRSIELTIVPLVGSGVIWTAGPYGSSSGEYLRVDFDSGGVVNNVTKGAQTVTIPFELQKVGGFTLGFPQEDAKAKLFNASPNDCAIYLYVRRSGGDFMTSYRPAYLRVDRRYVGLVGSDKWYFRVTLPPGTHTAAILDSSREKIPRFKDPLLSLHEDAPEVKSSLRFRCIGGSLVFIEIGYAGLVTFPSLRQVDSEEGRAAVDHGRLVIGAS